MLITHRLCLAFFLVFWPSVAGATDYYVDNTCANNGTGACNGTAPACVCAASWGAPGPFNAIASVNNASFKPGDDVYFKAGDTFREQLIAASSGSRGFPITFGAYGGGPAPIITGADLVTGWTATRWTSPSQAGASSRYKSITNLYQAPCTFNPNQVFEDGNRLAYAPWSTTMAATASHMSAGTWTRDPANKLLYVRTTAGDNPGNHTMEASHRTFAVQGYGASPGNYITIQYLHLTKATVGFDGIGTNVSLYGNLVDYNQHHGIRANGNGAVTYRLINAGWDIYGNTVAYNGADGMGLSSPFIYSIIGGDQVYANAQLGGIQPNGGGNGVPGYDNDLDYSAGIRIVGGYPYDPSAPIIGNIVQNNNVYDNGAGTSYSLGVQRGSGIWLDAVGPGNIVRYNQTSRNIMNGLKFDIPMYPIQIYYNLTWGNQVGIDVEGIEGYGVASPVGLRILNNTVYGNSVAGINMVGPNSPTVSNGCMNNSVINNISAGNGINLVAVYGCANDGGLGSGNVYTYNNFGPAARNFIEWVFHTYRSTYDSWETAGGNCGTAGCTHSVQANPRFVMAGSNAGGPRDFVLQPGSPAKWAGTYAGLTLDYGGHPVHIPPTLGAWEFVSEASSIRGTGAGIATGSGHR